MDKEGIWTGLASIALSIGGTLLAQVDSPSDITGVVGNLGAIGAVILLLWHTQTKVLPKIQADQLAAAAESRAANEKTAAEFRTQIAAILMDHRQEMASVREWHERAIMRMDANFSSLTSTINAFLRAQEIGREQAVQRMMEAIEQRRDGE